MATMEQHAIERYLSITEALGCGRGPVEFVFATDDADRQSVAELIGGIERYALLFPGTNWPTKRWPVENFAALVQPVEQRFGLKCVVAGSLGERESADRVSGAINLAGKTTLRQTTALIERASLVITNDSGPMHIAAALRRPMVALFGPTNPDRTGPYGCDESVLRLDIPCSPCYSRKCSHQSCLKWLKVDEVIRAAERAMGAPQIGNG
jgi:lipopolysaccharide heptosyltransferase II